MKKVEEEVSKGREEEKGEGGWVGGRERRGMGTKEKGINSRRKGRKEEAEEEGKANKVDKVRLVEGSQGNDDTFRLPRIVTLES